jgi:hypothetical protein
MYTQRQRFVPSLSRQRVFVPSLSWQKCRGVFILHEELVVKRKGVISEGAFPHRHLCDLPRCQHDRRDRIWFDPVEDRHTKQVCVSKRKEALFLRLLAASGYCLGNNNRFLGAVTWFVVLRVCVAFNSSSWRLVRVCLFEGGGIHHYNVHTSSPPVRNRHTCVGTPDSRAKQGEI